MQNLFMGQPESPTLQKCSWAKKRFRDVVRDFLFQSFLGVCFLWKWQDAHWRELRLMSPGVQILHLGLTQMGVQDELPCETWRNQKRTRIGFDRDYVAQDSVQGYTTPISSPVPQLRLSSLFESVADNRQINLSQQVKFTSCWHCVFFALECTGLCNQDQDQKSADWGACMKIAFLIAHKEI